MGLEPSDSDPMVRTGLEAALPAAVDGGRDMKELLVEPQRDWKAEDIAPDVLKVLDGTQVAELRHFVWLRVTTDMVEKLLSSNEELLSNLREYHVARIWPNLPIYPQQEEEYELSTVLKIIDADPQSNDGDGIRWVVIDTDVRDTHLDFSGMVERWEVKDTGVVQCASSFDPQLVNSGHGTHVAGIIHAVAPKAQIISLALEVQTLPDGFVLKDVAHLEKALQWVSRQADIDGVNISLGIHPRWQDPLVGMTPGCIALQDCLKQDQVVVVAAGNYGQRGNQFHEVSMTDPANTRGACVVGACATSDVEMNGIWSRSSHGPTADGRTKPDLVAPGIAIRSCWYTYDTDYSVLSGTSQAAAFVSGSLAALMPKAKKKKKPAEWTELLARRAVDLRRDVTYQGGGLLAFQRIATSLEREKS